MFVKGQKCINLEDRVTMITGTDLNMSIKIIMNDFCLNY